MPLLIAIAANSGDQPSFRSGRTCLFFNVYRKQIKAQQNTSPPTTNGMGVWMKGMSKVETTPRRMRVTRSPRHDATAGAILSGSRSNFLHKTMRVHINDPRITPDSAAAVIVADATITNL